MNCIVPFTKDIKFKTNIGEILSVSLEHEYTANNSEILGNFIITGDYKAHEVSVNKEHFEHVLPFSVELTTRIDSDSIDFSIEDFTYEIVDKDTLRVNIEYSINALEVPNVEEVKEELNFDDLLAEIDREEEEKEEQVEEVETPVLEESKNVEETKEDEKEDLRDDEMIEEVTQVDESTQNTIIESVTDADDLYVTYKIHIMQENDTVEAICTKYNISGSTLGEYNDITNLATGDKVVIPQVDE